MGWIKNTLVSALFLSTLFFPRIARAGAISGRIFDSHDNQTSDSTLVDVIINDGSSGTEPSKVPEWGFYGLWIVSSGNFNPIPGIGDTVKMSGQLDTGSKIYKTHMRRIYGSGGSGLILPTAFLDDPDKTVKAHAFGSWSVTDTSSIADTLKAEGWLAKNPDQKIPYINYSLRALNEDSTKVDTSDIYPQVAINLEKQDSFWNVNDSVFVRIYKSIEDTIWETKIGFPLDTLQHGCATLLDSIVFPETTYVNDQTPPSITNVTVWPDTSFVGPFDVEATITDAAGIKEEWLKYKLGSVSPESTNADSSVGDIYYYVIPSIVSPDSVHYQIKATDDSQNANVAYWPGPSSNEWHGFYVSPTSIKSNDIEAKLNQFKVWPTLVRDEINISGAKSVVDIYNVSGRKVAEFKNDNSNCTRTYDFDVPQGVYFVKPRGSKETKKVIKLK